MNHNADKIIDKELIKVIFEERLPLLKVFVKIKDISIPVESFKYENDCVIISIHQHGIDTDNVIIYARNNERIIASHANLKRKNNDNTYIFEPSDVIIFDANRKEERSIVENRNISTSTSSIYISNIISDFLINESFTASRRRVDFIKEAIIEKISLENILIKITLLNELHNDERMKFFMSERKPYFFKNLKDVFNSEKLKTDPELKRYALSIYPSDSTLEDMKIVSEISVPLLYKFMLPFGYIKAVSQEALTDNDFTVIRKFGMSVSTLFSNEKSLIKNSEEKIAVIDLSNHGLGIIFKDKRMIKHFKDNCLIIFTVFLPEEKQTTMLCIVRNISLIQNFIYRVGCEILNIESIGEVNYSEYLERL